METIILNGYGASLKQAYENEKTKKYVNVYYSEVTDGSSSAAQNYEYTNPNNTKGQEQHYGDALWETNGWYGGPIVYPEREAIFFSRGGYYGTTGNEASEFRLDRTEGNYASASIVPGTIGFRVVVAIIK